MNENCMLATFDGKSVRYLGMAYMSKPFEGNMSDRKIVEMSDFCPFLERGDEILGKDFFILTKCY